MLVPLSFITDYTLMKSLIKVKDLVNFCVQNNLKTCGIIDENLFSSIEFYKECLKYKIKPIIGLKVSINENIIYLYAKNYNGYLNLLKINSLINSNLTIKDINTYNKDIFIVIPYTSLNIKDNFNNVYLSYKDINERNELSNLTNNLLYLKEYNSLSKEDSIYLNYLSLISNNNLESSYYISDTYLQDNYNFSSLINIEIPFNNRYIPIYNSNIDSLSYLRNLCMKGLNKRLSNNIPKSYIDRLNYEIDIINKMGFVDYFLIVYDYVLFAKKNNILVGPGRGSAAGSLVSYVIGITDIDPLKYDLLFERFLNPLRITMPDIDIDFESTKRDKVIKYVKEKYGEDKVAGVLTFATFKTKLVLKDVAKVMRIKEELLDKFLLVIDRDLSLSDNLNNELVRKYLDNYDILKRLYKVSLKLEGLKKNVSSHAAGIVISKEKLDEIIPMYKDNDDYLCGVSLEDLESIGLLKMDFLSLKNLTTISNIISKIPNFNLSNIPLDDKNTYKIFSEANTKGIFQFETSLFKNMLVKYKPENFSELIASIALIRPGPKKELETYIRRKNNLEKFTYLSKDLENILKETYGVIVYQEQVISILVKMANFSYADADNVRRAMSKKKENIILDNRDIFIKGSIKNGYKEEDAILIYNQILEFADYGFNKAHSVSYAYISYAMAYLKANYKDLFILELLNDSLSKEDALSYLTELKFSNYLIMPVSINYSKDIYVCKNKCLILPFNSLINLKKEVIRIIMEEREKGLFTSIYDVFKRLTKSLSKDDFKILIKGFVLNEFKINPYILLNNLDSLYNYGEISNIVDNKPIIDITLNEVGNLRDLELYSYGYYINNHPSSKFPTSFKIKNINSFLFKNIESYVLIEDIKVIKTKNGDDMAFVKVSDDFSSYELTVFPDKFSYLNELKVNDFINYKGRVSKKNDKLSVIASSIKRE